MMKNRINQDEPRFLRNIQASCSMFSDWWNFIDWIRCLLEIKQLFGYDPKFKWYCSGLVALQVISLFYLQHKSWQFLLIAAYCFGGVINHSLSLAVHEIAHNLSFGHGRWVIKFTPIASALNPSTFADELIINCSQTDGESSLRLLL